MSLVLAGTVERGGFARAVSLTAEPGRPVGLTGPNGSGKSTTLRAISGLDRLSSGRITLDGTELDAPGVFVPAEDRRIGVVFQDLRLFPHLSARDNVAFGLRCAGPSRRDAHARAGELLAEVGASHVADRRPATLSGGEAQRVALARAFANGPRVLLLDEPFASVDAPSRTDLRGLVARMVRDRNICAVVVSHDARDLDELVTDIVHLGPDR